MIKISMAIFTFQDFGIFGAVYLRDFSPYLFASPTKSTGLFSSDDVNHVAEFRSSGAFRQSYLIYCVQYKLCEMSSCSISAENSLYVILMLKSTSSIDRTSNWLGKLCSTMVFVAFSRLWKSHLTWARKIKRFG